MKEADIRPRESFLQFLELAKRDSLDFFLNDEFVDIYCPACGTDAPIFQFDKSTFKYHLCPTCETLYASPRPTIKALSRYYTEAPSSRFWVDFSKTVLETRRKNMFIPRAAMINKIAEQYLGNYTYVFDIGGGHGVISEEIRKLHPNGIFTVVEPSSGLADMCREKGFSVVQKFMEEVEPGELSRDHEGTAIAMSFDILEHLFDPVSFLRSVGNVLRQGDLFIFTALNNFGFDLSILWEMSEIIFPPQHLTIFNIHSLQVLAERAGFEVIEMTTPGKLDVELVKKKADFVKDRFVSRLVNALDETGVETLQKLLSEYRLSSFVMGVTRAH